MNVSVTIDLAVPAVEKHWGQMERIAEVLTDARDSVQVSQPADNPMRLAVSFTVPKARQEDIVDRIGREFWNIEDYCDSSIGFGSEPRGTRRSRQQPLRRAL